MSLCPIIGVDTSEKGLGSGKNRHLSNFLLMVRYCDCTKNPVYHQGGWSGPWCDGGVCYMRQENGCEKAADGDGTWCFREIDGYHRDAECPMKRANRKPCEKKPRGRRGGKAEG